MHLGYLGTLYVKCCVTTWRRAPISSMYTSSWFHQEPVVNEISNYIREALRDTRDGYVRRILSSPALPYLSRHAALLCLTRQNRPWIILGEQGAVSRAGRKVGATKVFKQGRKSPWVPTLTGPFPNGQANANSWLGTKNALYYCVLTGEECSCWQHPKCFSDSSVVP